MTVESTVESAFFGIKRNLSFRDESSHPQR
jgi:hypothetical protein